MSFESDIEKVRGGLLRLPDGDILRELSLSALGRLAQPPAAESIAGRAVLCERCGTPMCPTCGSTSILTCGDAWHVNAGGVNA